MDSCGSFSKKKIEYNDVVPVGGVTDATSIYFSPLKGLFVSAVARERERVVTA